MGEEKEEIIESKKETKKVINKEVIKENKKTGQNYTYILSCSDGTLYTGWTTDLERRLRTHNEGNGAKYTRSRIPVQLAYYETFSSKVDAMRREYAIKQLSREEKLDLIRTQKSESGRQF